VRHREAAESAEDEDGGEREGGESEAGAPVLEEEGDQDAGEEEAVGREVQRELREEGRQLPDVSVYPLDELAGRVVVVEAHVQGQRALGELGAQRVGRRPGHALPEVGDRQGYELLREREADEGGGCGDQDPDRLALSRRVDEGAHDLGDEEAHPNAAQEEGGQGGEPRPLRPDVPRQELPVGLEGEPRRGRFFHGIPSATRRRRGLPGGGPRRVDKKAAPGGAARMHGPLQGMITLPLLPGS
jgi:hypothetical protein